MKTGCYLFVLLFANPVFAQTPSPDYLLKELAKNDQQVSLRYPGLVRTANTLDSTARWGLLRQMEEKTQQRKDKFLHAHFLQFKNSLLNTLLPYQETVQQRFRDAEQALKMAEELDSDILMAELCNWYSVLLYNENRMTESQFYFWKSIALIEKAGPEYFTFIGERFTGAGAISYHMRDYDNCIKYSRKALANKSYPVTGAAYYSCFNNIGLAFYKMGNTDSAIYYFDKAAAECASQNKPDHIWVTIPQANKAQIWFAQHRYADAKPLFEADYASSIVVNEIPNAANNLQWLAKIDLVEGKTDSALKKCYRAVGMLQQWTNPEYLANTYQTLADIYIKKNRVDSSTKYSALYAHLHDSLEVVTALNSTEVIRLKLNDEQHLSALASLEEQRQNERLRLSAIITVIILLAVIGWMYYNRQLAKQKQQQQLKEIALQSARDKMELFLKTIDEKSGLVDQLQQEIEQRNLSPEVVQTLEDLKQKTILTEEDWINFQNLFEKIYPGFFEKFKIDFPGITYAELRFAAIIRLQLNNKQAGAMLGISSKSASKTRLRLRQRMNIADDKDLEQFILSV